MHCVQNLSERTIFTLNYLVKELIKNSRFKQYEIAAKIGISEFNFSRWFRRELTPEQVEKIKAAITELKAGDGDD